MVIRRQKVAQVQKAPAANDNLPTTTPPPAAPTARLVKGECVAFMDSMVAGSVDLVVTSPPYLNIGMHYGDTFASIEDYIEFSRQWITAAARVLKPGGAMWINVGMHKAGPNSRVPITYYLFPLIAGTGLTFVQEIVWDRRAQQNTTQRFSTRSERWLYLVKPGVLKGARGRPKTIYPTFNLDDVRRPSTSADKRNNPAGANPADIWAFTQVHGTAKERTSHPCPFPQAMIERIVLACSNPGDVVLDPFGGSGTTGAAAIEHGRSAVLIEREPSYWPIIEKRLGLVDRHVVGRTETGVELFADFHNGDAIEKMKLIPSKSVNLILVDPPYGTTNCEWDQTLPAAEMWSEYERILAPNGMIVIHAAQPFSIDLILSNRPWFRQQLIWKKNRPVGFLHSNRRHLASHEEVLVFARPRGKMTYNPQGVTPKAAKVTRRGKVGAVYRDTYTKGEWTNDTANYPQSVLEFDCERDHGHPTQKPQALAEYLIRTYSNPGEVVLDHCYGSGTTGAAAMATGRSFIGVERDAVWFVKGRARILGEVRTSELGGKSAESLDARFASLSTGRVEASSGSEAWPEDIWPEGQRQDLRDITGHTDENLDQPVSGLKRHEFEVLQCSPLAASGKSIGGEPRAHIRLVAYRDSEHRVGHRPKTETAANENGVRFCGADEESVLHRTGDDRTSLGLKKHGRQRSVTVVREKNNEVAHLRASGVSQRTVQPTRTASAN
ncbi:site-specific DNA-methyltransferase [Brevundimonas vitis]|uniref:Site-specific DNA-methyltransferase n=1 Tax=Brevundimonas vitisensis TaxID=2800818 RepID=A0ABX7BRI3_9CAUL|nr:site-specific DNA-methyltransferase [Brevundimonas vitisensis]QQQ18120.1 site-specific DNA-methyltransferase [Brevundimonas vitisensis]